MPGDQTDLAAAIDRIAKLESQVEKLWSYVPPCPICGGGRGKHANGCVAQPQGGG